MEKFTNWRDKATGISPFMPTHRPKKLAGSPPAVQALKLDEISHFLVVLAKLVLGLPVLATWFLLAYFGLNLSWLDTAFALVAAGFSSELSIEGIRTKNISDSLKLQPNDLVFANFTSPFDYFGVLAASSTRKVVLATSINHQLYALTPRQLVLKSLGSHLGSTLPKLDAATCRGKVLVVFAEGTTTNGKAVMKFDISQQGWNSYLDQIDYSYKVRSLTIKLVPSHLTTPMPIAPWRYWYRVLGCLRVTAKLRINSVNNGRDINDIRKSFTNNGKLKLVEFDTNDKLQLLQVYKGRV